MSKYGAKKVTLDGITFDSAKEAKRYTELKYMLRVGMISDFILQKEFELVPKVGNNRAVKYRADFCYVEKGKDVVEDCKGFKTPEYKIKKKLMAWRYGIFIKET